MHTPIMDIHIDSPDGICPLGTELAILDDRPPVVRELLFVHARGLVRQARVSKVTPKRVELFYIAPSTGRAHKTIVRRGDDGRTGGRVAENYVLVRAEGDDIRWRVERNHGEGSRGHRLAYINPEAK